MSARTTQRKLKTPSRSRVFFISAFCLALGVSGAAQQSSPDRIITQFQHTSWSAREGAPAPILAFAQTTDDYLWLGTLNGLFRFDGVRFEQYQPKSGESFLSNQISALLALPDGGLWIGFSRGGASLLMNDHLTNYGEAEGLPQGRLAAFAQDGAGKIWAGTASGLARLEEGRWKRIGNDWNFTGKSVQSMLIDRKGTLWVATEQTILFLPQGAKAFQGTGENVSLAMQIAEAPDGRLWIADTASTVRLLRYPDRNARVPEIHAGSQAILFDGAGALWVTSVGDGIIRAANPGALPAGVTPQNSPAVTKFTTKNGLTDDFVISLFQDRENNIWAGTPRGLEKFRNTSLVPVPFPSGYQGFALGAGDGGTLWVGSLSRPLTFVQNTKLTPLAVGTFAISGYRDSEGITWMGGAGQLYRIINGKIRILRSHYYKDSDPGGLVNAITKGPSGALWLALKNGELWRMEKNVWRRYQNAALPQSVVTAEYADAQGRVWLGYGNDLLAMLKDEHVHVFSKEEGVATGVVKAIQGRAEDVWIGGELGLAFYKQGRFQMLGAEGPTPFRGISGIVETADGSIWLSESRGVVQIPPVEVQAAFRDPAYRVHYQLFGFVDGLPGAIQQIVPPTAIEATDGRLWFATSAGLAWIDPAHIIRNGRPPHVVVQSINATGMHYQPEPAIHLPVGTTNIEIDYTALSLSVPERVRFRYKLEGIDKDWQDGGTRRQAFFSNLGPRHYRFRVIACNNDGVWNEIGATLDFNIAPAFYQTGWFKALNVAAGLCGLYLLYLMRLKQVTRQVRARMAERFDEREKIARDLHDTLLQSVQGLILKFHALARQVPAGDVRQGMERALDHADQVLAEGRNRVRSLRGADDAFTDLSSAFQRVAKEDSPELAANVKVVVEGNVRELNPMVLEESFSIGREALINALHHSGGLHVEIEISYHPRQFRLRVRDDGRGIDSSILEQGGRPDHWGLPGMRERAEKIGAQLQLWSRPKTGTEVALTVPGTTAYRAVQPRLRKFRSGRPFRMGH
jgi:ligand-binding sensor domain-containing protein